MGRAPCCDKANVKKGPWSPEEDAKLKDYIENFGTGGNWIALPQKAGLKRCGKSCRLRWLNYLRPNIKHGEFSDDEDRIICSLYASIGSRWSIIAAQLPGRTDNDIKNYWNTKLKKKLMMGNIINNNIITPNSSIINPKKSLNPYHYHYPNYSSMFHNHQFNHYPSSSLLSNHHVISPSPSPSFQCTSSTLEYNTTTTPSNLSSSMTMSFTHQGYKSSNDDDDLILMQNNQVKDNSTLLVFGAHDNHHHHQHQHHDHHQHHQVHQPSSCSSDGSCSVVVTPPVKVEDHHHHHHHQNYGNFSNGVVQRIIRSGDDDHHHHDATSSDHHNNNMKVMVDDEKPSFVSENNNVGIWGQNGQSTSLLDYGLEEIKQLISTTNYFDDIKAPEKDTKVMYYYY